MASKLIDQTIRAAIQEFARAGYSGAATKSIAVAAKITEGSLFRLFGSKEKLFELALRRAIGESFSAGRFAAAFHDYGTTLDEFKAAIKRALRDAIDERNHDATRIVAFAVLERPDLARSLYWTEFNLANGVLAEILESLQKDGLVRNDVDPDFAAQFVLAAFARYSLIQTIPSKLPPHKWGDHKPLDCWIDLWIDSLRPMRDGGTPAKSPTKAKRRSKQGIPL